LFGETSREEAIAGEIQTHCLAVVCERIPRQAKVVGERLLNPVRRKDSMGAQNFVDPDAEGACAMQGCLE
jgi:hypothetical protein